MTTGQLSRRAILLAGPALALGGCAAVGLATPPQLYGLSAPRGAGGDAPAVGWQLLIDTPVAAAGLDTSAIAVSEDGMRLSFVTGANWVDRAPVMVQSLLVEAFENSGRIPAVARDIVGLRADYILMGELRDFQAEYDGGAPAKTPALARVRLHAKLVRMPGRTIVDSRLFEQAVRADQAGLAGTVAAFDGALSALLGEVVAWTLQAGRARPAA